MADGSLLVVVPPHRRLLLSLVVIIPRHMSVKRIKVKSKTYLTMSRRLGFPSLILPLRCGMLPHRR